MAKQLFADFRHTCEQHEGMAGYGWDEYDTRQGGRQTIHDAGNQLDLTTDFVKFPGGSHGGSWGVRVKGTPRADAPERLLSTIVFYSTMEGLGSLGFENEPDSMGFEGTVTLTGETQELGRFKIDVTTGPETNAHPHTHHEVYASKPLDRTLASSLQAPPEALWQTKGLLFQQMKEDIDSYIAKYGNENNPPPWQVYTIPNKVGPGNLHFVQKVFEGPFEFDIIYSSGSASGSITSKGLTEKIESTAKSFSQRFGKLLAPKAPFDKPKYLEFAKSMFSNLAGGIGYFYGDSVVDRSYAPEYEEENEGFWQETADARSRAEIKVEGPTELFTSIPSRPFFPRGFLWDEGFHLLPICEWDMDLTLDIVRSWFKLMDEDGWIGREQILGNEARSKVPSEFQVQYPHYANPPTLFLVLEALMDKISTAAGKTPDDSDPYDSIRNSQIRDTELTINYLKDFYPLIKRHYFWFRKTQWGDIKSYDREAFSTKEAYRWRGRTVEHILPSGLDDYPRPQPPHPGELHTDLISWVGMMTRSMRRIAKTLGETDDAKEFQDFETAILRNIDDLHWDSKEKTYCDATIDDYEESVHACHVGYISIFPFLTGLLPPDSPRLGPILDSISDPEKLWSDYGIRSLSKEDEFYGTGENYWRNPIWMNMNFLVVKNLLVREANCPLLVTMLTYQRQSPRPKAHIVNKRGICIPSYVRI